MNEKPIALIQLVSEQSMQNVVPTLALNPVRLIHLTTPRFAARSVNVAEAARILGHQLDFQNRRLPEMPTIAESARAIRSIIDESTANGLLPVINFTGGTKLMSIGAYAASMNRATAFYVDTEHRRFIESHNGAPPLSSILGDDLSFTRFSDRLTVNAVARANGCNAQARSREPEPFRELARYLLAHPDQESSVWEAVHGKHGVCPGGIEPRDISAWAALFSKNLALPFEVGALAAAAGLVEPAKDGYRLPSRMKEAVDRVASRHLSFYDYRNAVAAIQSALGFLAGGWWEVAVLDSALSSGLFRDLMWGANFGGGHAGGSMEEDIVGLDGVQIVYISCKRGGARAKLLPLLNEIDARSQRIGGRFCRKFLAVLKPIDRRILRDLTPRASSLGIKLIGPAEIANPASFAAEA